jgi:hypothetical protein
MKMASVIRPHLATLDDATDYAPIIGSYAAALPEYSRDAVIRWLGKAVVDPIVAQGKINYALRELGSFVEQDGYHDYAEWKLRLGAARHCLRYVKAKEQAAIKAQATVKPVEIREGVYQMASADVPPLKERQKQGLIDKLTTAQQHLKTATDPQEITNWQAVRSNALVDLACLTDHLPISLFAVDPPPTAPAKDVENPWAGWFDIDTEAKQHPMELLPGYPPDVEVAPIQKKSPGNQDYLDRLAYTLKTDNEWRKELNGFLIDIRDTSPKYLADLRRIISDATYWDGSRPRLEAAKSLDRLQDRLEQRRRIDERTAKTPPVRSVLWLTGTTLLKWSFWMALWGGILASPFYVNWRFGWHWFGPNAEGDWAGQGFIILMVMFIGACIGNAAYDQGKKQAAARKEKADKALHDACVAAKRRLDAEKSAYETYIRQRNEAARAYTLRHGSLEKFYFPPFEHGTIPGRPLPPPRRSDLLKG